ncbi:MAG: hypothetical protein HYX74_06885 [Acidobacteria bacterium]|nr:hypothetical protein [Acidobacteriota bacterium]
MRQVVIRMLLMPLLLQAPDGKLSAYSLSEKAIEQSERQRDGRPIEEQLEQAIDEKAVEKQVERHIDRIMGDVRPSEWWLHAVLALLTPFALFALVAMIAWLLYRKSQAQMRARMEFHAQLLGKFASGSEFTEFMEGKGGQKFLEGVWSRPLDAKERIMTTARAGVVLTVLGLGALGVSLRTPDLLVPAGLVLALGVGYLIATAFSYRLSQKLGLVKDNASDTVQKPVSPS